MTIKSDLAWRTILLTGGLLAFVPALAHHSFMAEFDQRQPITLEGTVRDVQWINPHTVFFLDVKDNHGKTTKWELQTGSPSALIDRGWTRDTVKAGDHVKVYAYRAKNKPTLAAARSVILDNGRTLFGGQTDDGGPAK